MTLLSLPSKRMSQFQGASVFTVSVCVTVHGNQVCTVGTLISPSQQLDVFFVVRKLSPLKSLKLVSADVPAHAHTHTHYRFSLESHLCFPLCLGLLGI